LSGDKADYRLFHMLLHELRRGFLGQDRPEEAAAWL
jgi:hypothetical protein